ncbi:MAG: DUF6691 family protein [Halioglobus sp.]
MKNLMALMCGSIFGIGLAASGMTDTSKVLGFLDIAGSWVPDLAFVMGGAVLVTLITFPLILKRTRPVFTDRFHVPTITLIDKRLVVGSALFGIGWGIYGYCPGPALSALVYLQPNTFIFVAAMLAGIYVAARFPTST